MFSFSKGVFQRGFIAPPRFFNLTGEARRARYMGWGGGGDKKRWGTKVVGL